MLQLVNGLNYGGAEGQFVERIRTLDRTKWRVIVGALKPKGPNLEGLRAIGIEPRELKLAGTLAHPVTALAVARLAAWIRAEGVRLVHAQDVYTNLLAVPAARLAGAKVIVSRLDLGHHHGPHRRQMLALASRLADRVQVNASAIRRQVIEEDGVRPEAVSLVMNGLDLAAFDAKAAQPVELPLPPGTRAITVVANLHPVKAQEDVIDALAKLPPRHGDVRLLLVGEGDRRGPLQERAAAAGLAERVLFLGHRPDVPGILRRAVLSVSSSRAEGLSNSVMEAMAAGLPVIATRVGGNPELVEDGVRGLLVPSRSPAAIARAITHLLDREHERRAMGERARAFVEHHLTMGEMAKSFEALYDDVLGAGMRRSA